jgi:predicted nucleic acid-binding protein
VIAYVDASVLLRMVLSEAAPLAEWPEIKRAIGNPLVSVECYRTLDRYWLQGRLDDAEVEAKREEIGAFLKLFEVTALDGQILRVAAQPFPTIVATLDALHLVSAMLYRAVQPPDERPIVFATHDVQLARAARAMNFEVLGA